jgi:2-phospho-L-lactate guanylyltransferase
MHSAEGVVEVRAAAPSVRADIDDVADLEAALVAGVGPQTTRASGRRATHQE